MNEKAYKCWYEFLKRSVRYKECCSLGGKGPLAALYRDFGDVHALAWTKWWKTHKKLFSDVEPLFVINEVKTNAEFAHLFEEGEDDLLALVVNLNAPTETILKKIDSVLRRLNKKRLKKENELQLKENPKGKGKKKLGRPKFDPSFYHNYGLTPVPSTKDVKALEMMLKVYDACLKDDQKPRNQRKFRYEIGEELGIEIKPMNTEDTGPPSSESLKNTMTATVCRYNKKAKELIESTERGFFPIHRGSRTVPPPHV